MHRISTSPDKPSQATSWHIIGGVLLICLLTRLLLSLFVSESPPAEPVPNIELPPMRLTEGRLSGQTAYAPYPTPPDERLLVRRLRRAPVSLRERVLYRLLANDLDRAVAEMEQAVRTTPGEALLLSDLSALYSERARAKNQPEDYVAALEMAERAVAIGPNVAEAAFNRNLALTNLFLYERTDDELFHYAVLEDLPSPWMDEARERWRKLKDEDRQLSEHRHRYSSLLQQVFKGDERAIVRFTVENPQQAHGIFEATFLPDWAEAVERGQDDRASLRLAGARRIAETLAGRGQNRIFLRIVAEMEAVVAKPAGQKETATLVRSLRRYKLGRDEMHSGHFTDAIRDLGTAEQELRSIKSAAEVIAVILKAYCQLRQDDLPGARTALMRLGQDPRLMDYPSLEARRQSYLAALARTAGDLSGALAAYRRALDLFHSLGETSNVAEMQNQIASVLEALGQPAEAWRYRYLALAWTRRFPANEHDRILKSDRRQLSIALNTFEGAVQASLAQRRPEAALQLQTRAISLAKALEQPEAIALALLTRARIEAALGRQEAAQRDFRKALNILPSEPNWASELLAARIDMTRSEIADAESRAAAIASESFVPEHLDQQADLDFRRGDTEAGEKTLERALDELERRRERVAPGTSRVSYFDQAQPLYERMVALQVHLARPERALEMLERFHAQSLLDRLGKFPAGNASTTPLDWRDLCRRIPEHTALSVYGMVEDRLVTWLVRPSGIWLSPQRPDRISISSRVQRLQKSGAGEAERGALLRQLYRDLVAPWKGKLAEGDRIIFVPAGDLYRVPFAALIDPASGRFLIEDNAIGVAPSVSEFIASVERDRRVSAKPLAKVLLVGDPVRSEVDLPPLPGSAQEIRLLTNLYRGTDTQVLTRAQATPERVLASLSETDIAHFAVHARGDFENPILSRLLLSPSISGLKALSVGDLLKERLIRTRLIVLAACNTHTGAISESEGSLSLARSFLVAGVPAVVGSLWTVDDKSTARLSVRFHQELLRGADALTALRAAQREEIAAQRPLSNWTWASFQIYGGVEERVP